MHYLTLLRFFTCSYHIVEDELTMNDLRNLSGRELKTRSSDFTLSINLTAHVTMTNYVLNKMIINKISLNDENN